MVYKLEDKDFYQWLAGFWEGEGSFILKHRKNGIALLCIFQIVQKNIEPLLYIKDYIRFGTVKLTIDKKNRECYRLLIYNYEDVIKIVESMLPYLVFRKVEVENKLNKIKEYIRLGNCIKRWTDEENLIIRQNLNLNFSKLVKLLPNRTYQSIATRKSNMKILSS